MTQRSDVSPEEKKILFIILGHPQNGVMTQIILFNSLYVSNPAVSDALNNMIVFAT